jgi:hypothetical protein
LLNGNLKLNHRINQLDKWFLVLSNAPKLNISDYNLKNIPSIIKLPSKPSL